MSRRAPSRDALEVDSDTSVRLGRIRQHGTAAELLVRRAVSVLGLRYRVSNRDLPGSPDLANRAHRWAIFVHGCFWHRHRGCIRTTTPKRNRAFWLAKFDANVARDRRARRALVRQGFTVIVVWECEAEDSRMLAKRLQRLSNTKPTPASCEKVPRVRPRA